MPKATQNQPPGCRLASELTGVGAAWFLNYLFLIQRRIGTKSFSYLNIYSGLGIVPTALHIFAHLMLSFNALNGPLWLVSSFTYEETGSERGRDLPTSHSQEAAELNLNPDLPETDMDAVTCLASLPSPLCGTGVRIRAALDFR